MRKQLVTGLLVTIVLSVVLGVAYPLAVTAVAAVAFPHQASGSLVRNAAGRVIGSSLIGQQFLTGSGAPDPRYFQPRPSAVNDDPTQSGAANLGPSSDALLCPGPASCDAKTYAASVPGLVAWYRSFNGLAATSAVPVDAVTTSGSGLDPDISEANALDQAGRVARARELDASRVAALVRSHVQARPWGFLGEASVNVLDLNLALDKIS